MSPKTRNTDRISATVEPYVVEELEKFANRTNESKSRVVENALIEYLGLGPYGQLESKVDKILEQLGASDDPTPTVAEISGEKKNNSQGEDSEFDLESYDPDSEVGTLSKEDLRDLAQGDEPVINIDHIDCSDLPGDTDLKADIVAATLRYDHETTVNQSDIENRIGRILGDSDYYISEYSDKVGNRLHRFKDVVQNGSIPYSVAEGDFFFLQESDRLDHLRSRFEKVKEATQGKLHETPEPDGETIDIEQIGSYEYYRAWVVALKYDLEEAGIASMGEVEAIHDELVALREEVDAALEILIELQTEWGAGGWFKRDDALDALDYERSDASDVLVTFDLWAYITEKSGDSSKSKVVEDNVIRGKV
jgi:hypothetical protein